VSDGELAAAAERHLQFGWWALLAFLSLGIVLESFHGFKIGWYTEVANETRRHLWTLAHAHGTLLALVNLAFGLSLQARGVPRGARLRTASRCLLAGSVLVPLGFLLGGVSIHAGDPGLGILLLPFGAALLFAAVLIVALAQRDP